MSRVARTATNVIVALTTLAFVILLVLGWEQWAALALGFIPARLSIGLAMDYAAAPAFLTPLTATLVHSGLLHLGFNMLILWFCGSQVERVVGASGLVTMYIVGAFAAAGLQWLAAPMELTPMIGASGAVSAVIGAYSLSFGRAKSVTRSPRINRWLNALWLLAAWIVLQLMMSWLAGAQGYVLATPAHVGGFAAGLLLQRPLLLWRYRSA